MKCGRLTWDLIGFGGLLLWGFLTELAFAIRVVQVDDDWVLARDFAVPLALGGCLLVAGLCGRTWQARWRSRRKSVTAPSPPPHSQNPPGR